MKSKTINNAENINLKSSVPAEEIVGILEQSKSVLVASHVDPDGDALGTQLAFASYLKKSGKSVHLVREDDIPEKYLFLTGLDEIKHIQHYIGNELEVDTAIILECPRLTRAGNIVNELKGNCKIINIDHHQDNEGFGEVVWIDKKASSVGEMVFEFFDSVGYEIDEPTSIQLYTAIITDTGRFRFDSTTGRTMEIAGKLIETGADPHAICDKIYFNMPQSTLKLIGYALHNAEFLQNNRVCVLSLSKEILHKNGARLSDTEGLAEYTLYGKEVEVGVLLKEGSDGITRVSMRSSGRVNVADLAATFGGGGHICAAGCSIEKELLGAKKELLQALSEIIDA